MKNRELNSRAYLCRLPEEILVAIVLEATMISYGFYAPSNVFWPNCRLSNHLFNTSLRMEEVEALAHVCHHLRRVILGTTRLWTNVSGETSGFFDAFTHRTLSRSGSSELRVRLDDDVVAPPKTREFFNPTNILGQMDRVGHLSIKNFKADNCLVLDHLFDFPSGAIRSLEVSVGRSKISSIERYATSDLFQGHAPNLQRLELHGIATSWTSSIFDHLTTLFLHDIPEASRLTISDLLEILERCRSTLVDLVLGDVFLEDGKENPLDSRPRKSVDLPQFRRFLISGRESVCRGFVQSLKAPSVERYHNHCSADTFSENEADLLKDPILPMTFGLGNNCMKLRLSVTGSSFKANWWNDEHDPLSEIHHELIYDSHRGAELNWSRILRVFRQTDNTGITSLTFRGDTMTTEKTQIHPFLSSFPNLEEITFTMSSNRPVFCNPVVNGLLLLHENEDVAGTLPLPRLQTLVFFASAVNCHSRAARARHWNHQLETLDPDSREWKYYHNTKWLLAGGQVDSCVLSNLKKTLEIRNAKGAKGIAVHFRSCSRIRENSVKDFLMEPFVSSIVFEECTSD
ncbi:hypothetical protein SCHPADRAFT_998318 [Schizopora paradoxa]|uniref:Uncharacterized protein n=1 Tax=Schizopora paradoxa TaxID=27342 RepID=A0A0H2S5Q5_9AGAM|nr:hypothetical protein SCHPADRAFT_998318 [Schizopora paradoxa]